MLEMTEPSRESELIPRSVSVTIKDILSRTKSLEVNPFETPKKKKGEEEDDVTQE